MCVTLVGVYAVSLVVGEGASPRLVAASVSNFAVGVRYQCCECVEGAVSV